MKVIIDQKSKIEALPEAAKDKVAEQLALSAIVIQDLKAKRIKVRKCFFLKKIQIPYQNLITTKDYDFSWDRMLQAEGLTGPYLQYTHARVCSIERQTPFDAVRQEMEMI